jgi:RNA polymerase sigma-70 factor (ECF subfamily)
MNATHFEPYNELLHPQQFEQAIEPYRGELRAHCYRMLGSIHEAEETVQEVFLRAWSERQNYTARGALRAWLYKIATNLCIDSLRRKPRRLLPITRQAASTLAEPIPPSVLEPVWLEPYPAEIAAPNESSPEAHYARSENIRLAFIALLHLLPPFQRAVLILRDVLGWSAMEAAQALGQSIPAVKSALYRARLTLAKSRPALQLETMPEQLAEQGLNGLLERYVQAWENADVQGLVDLLSDRATFSMPPIPSWYRGQAEIGGLVGRTVFAGQGRGRWRLLPTEANAQPGFGLYRLNEAGSAYEPYGIQVITFAGGQIADITTFRDPSLLEIFGLPGCLEM